MTDHQRREQQLQAGIATGLGFLAIKRVYHRAMYRRLLWGLDTRKTVGNFKAGWLVAAAAVFSLLWASNSIGTFGQTPNPNVPGSSLSTDAIASAMGAAAAIVILSALYYLLWGICTWAWERWYMATHRVVPQTREVFIDEAQREVWARQQQLQSTYPALFGVGAITMIDRSAGQGAVAGLIGAVAYEDFYKPLQEWNARLAQLQTGQRVFVTVTRPLPEYHLFRWVFWGSVLFVALAAATPYV